MAVNPQARALCGAQILARLLLQFSNICWLSGSPRRFQTCVGNRVSHIVDRIPQIDGDMWPALKMLLIVLPKGYFLRSWNSLIFGEEDKLGYSLLPDVARAGQDTYNSYPLRRELCHVTTIQTKPNPIMDPCWYSSFSIQSISIHLHRWFESSSMWIKWIKGVVLCMHVSSVALL